ncbi:PhzF family phenazine biosynthesis protein [Ensifer sp. Root142]|uniref:PhzF family phenazine biosynthesis protein n=1 Tax=Ensifer sp. Root142 TaxID=1736461 RepID=UPI003242467B
MSAGTPPLRQPVRGFVPDLAAIANLGPVGLVVTGQEAEGAKADFVSRYFAPGAGIPEDPVTGSIHATLVPYWVARLGHDKLMGLSGVGTRRMARLRTDQ